MPGSRGRRLRRPKREDVSAGSSCVVRMPFSAEQRLDGSMWTCPECGRSFANRNQWHACQNTTVHEALFGETELAVSIYEAVESALRQVGEFRVHPQKTRIAFISRMTFAGVALARNWGDLTFILPEPLDDLRIEKLELFGPTSWGHTIRLYRPEDVDESVKTWLSMALRRGNQETLDPAGEVLPLTEQQLSVFWTGFRGRVDRVDGNLIVRLPGYVSDALALVGEVVVRVHGNRFQGSLVREEGDSWLSFDPELGFGDGDQTDVFLEVDP